MLKLGFTMEELMFPENYQSNFLFNIESNCLLDKLGKMSPIYDYQEQITIDDDDWFTIKQLNSETSSNNNNMNLVSDQTLSVFDIFSDNYYVGQVKSMVELDGTITALLLPNLSIQVARDKNNTSLTSDVVSITSSSPCDQRLLTTTTNTIIQQKRQQQPPNKHMMSKSTSSLSFCTHSSTSMTSNSADEMSSNSNDLNEITTVHHSTESAQQLSHHYKHNRSISDDSLNTSNRRRRKRTIFSAADIEHLKEAFIQNPKPSQQDIAILSEQLGHDSYVIRVWFYNKRQATKKRN
ncbi:unnamed protein product [Rotaria sp. Silwood1]|nr:unnamed protein product [Rotaria sp. Silwood1]CAF3457694.1 unnamed protein product [Rotaria sp. Silwood1]CAF3458113.1 unnamed protein product [Rotaria sp. Silwood1]CAF3477889.1 unnamed protein product [Rotaria sp. Silwood1]CAF4609190.1 unnamed protein product [Rotaria sp. Silwood1]